MFLSSKFRKRNQLKSMRARKKYKITLVRSFCFDIEIAAKKTKFKELMAPRERWIKLEKIIFWGTQTGRSKFKQKLTSEVKAIESKQAAPVKSIVWQSKINYLNSRLQSLPEQS